MAKPKYKLVSGAPRTPEEHRKILLEIDTLQNDRSRKGVATSKKRIANGMSSTEYRKSRKSKKEKKTKFYEPGRNIYDECGYRKGTL